MHLQDIYHELQQEAAVTRKFLERVPFDQLSYQPTAKSETLGRLAVHVAEIVAWWESVLTTEALDFIDFEPCEFENVAQLLDYYDGLLAAALQAIQDATPATMVGTWSMRHGEIVYFTLSKMQALRIFCMNHWIHHRAQLGMYLRLLDVPLPATYGPSADDEDVLLITPFGK